MQAEAGLLCGAFEPCVCQALTRDQFWLSANVPSWHRGCECKEHRVARVDACVQRSRFGPAHHALCSDGSKESELPVQPSNPGIVDAAHQAAATASDLCLVAS
jgi:hypothetical protein